MRPDFPVNKPGVQKAKYMRNQDTIIESRAGLAMADHVLTQSNALNCEQVRNRRFIREAISEILIRRKAKWRAISLTTMLT